MATELSGPLQATPAGRLRARALGVPLGGAPGPANAITDVAGVEVGYATLIEGEAVRTGVTAIHPRGRGGAGDPCAAGFVSLNGNGEMTGTTWIEESGALSVPVLLTSTHAVGPCHQGAIEWLTGRRPDLAGQWLLPVVAETWDGYLNDANGGHVTPAHARAALDAASPGLPASSRCSRPLWAKPLNRAAELDSPVPEIAGSAAQAPAL